MIGRVVQFFTCNGNIKLFLILIFIDPKIIVYMLLLALYFYMPDEYLSLNIL